MVNNIKANLYYYLMFGGIVLIVISFWLLLIVLNYYIDAIQDDFEKEYSIVDLFEKKRIRIR